MDVNSLTEAKTECDFLSPLIFVAILVRNSSYLFPYFLGNFENIDYPKPRLILHFVFPSEEEYDANIESLLRKWTSSVSEFYGPITFEHLLDESGFHLTNAMQEAHKMNADYAFFISSHIIIQHSKILRALISANQPVVGPRMRCPFSEESNFWLAESSKEEYIQTLLNRYKDTVKVSLVHSIFLINLLSNGISGPVLMPRNQLPSTSSSTNEHNKSLVFAQSAMDSFDVFLLANEIYGYLPASGVKSNEQFLVDLASIRFDSLTPLLYSPFLEPKRKGIDNLGIDQIYIINLIYRPERLARMQFSLELLGFSGTRWPAVDGHNIDQEYIEQWGIVELPLQQIGLRPMFPGEIGCMMSHINVWQDVVNKGYEMVMIMEDDMRFHAETHSFINEVLSDLATTGLEWDLIYLARQPKGSGPDKPVVGHRHLTTVWYSWGMYAYLLSARGARKLLAPEPWKKMVQSDEYVPVMYDGHPNEDFNQFFPVRDLKAFSVYPLIIEPTHWENDPEGVSDTDH